jgi:alanine dehydrogenase
MRVGATTGLAAKYLAPPDAREVALLGSGWQAGTQAMAIAHVRSIARIRCYSPNRERREAFAREMRTKLGIDIVAAESAREAVSGAGIVLCATNSMAPVLPKEWLEPGMHVSSISRLELDADVLAQADAVVVHVREAASKTVRTTGTDLAKDVQEKRAAHAAKVALMDRPELSDLLLGRTPGRRSDRDITVFLNHAGLGYQFAATGHVIYTKARELDLGRELDTELFTSALPS